jgi:hypothetical protein
MLSSRTKASILACCQRLSMSDDIEGVVIFGSQVSEACDALSDVDILCVTSQGDRNFYSEICEGRTLDIHTYSSQELTRVLNPANWRSNIPLLALKSGEALSDKSGKVAALQVKARTLWSEGTGTLPIKECDGLAHGLFKLSQSVEKAIRRIEESTEGHEVRGLLLLQLQALHLSAITLYQRSFGAWAYPPWVTVRFDDAIYKDIALRNSQVFGATSVSVMSEYIIAYCRDALNHMTLRKACGGLSLYKR